MADIQYRLKFPPGQGEKAPEMTEKAPGMTSRDAETEPALKSRIIIFFQGYQLLRNGDSCCLFL